MHPPCDSGKESLSVAYHRLRAAWAEHGEVDVRSRCRALEALRAVLTTNANAFAAALNDDFRGRSRHESLLTEVALLISAIDYSQARIKQWAKPRRLPLEWPHWTATATLVKRGRGVAGIIGPGNYPLQLVLMPLVSALSAGCRTLLKPSEAAPRVAELLRSVISTAVEPEVVSVVTGDATISASLAALPLDVLLFSGSHRVGRKVAAAAARELTPVILELGGKSAVIVDRTADLKRAAISIMRGKLVNAGQTCVAPDYLLVPRESMEDMIRRLRSAACSLYPNPCSGDYTAILSETEYDRLLGLEAGQTTQRLFASPVARPLYEPKLIIEPTMDSAVMLEEIFGPLLPIVPYDTLDDAITTVNLLPAGLVLYWFGASNARFHRTITETTSATVSANETVLHASISAIPLGGIGASGMGCYHGLAGFDAFSHSRPIFEQSRFNLTDLMRPPYGVRANAILKRLLS